jgi:CRISPR-associated protein Csm1
MTAPLYVAGEFYGIQKYVLGITAAGGGQAKRLRARSFAVQVMGDIVAEELGALGATEVIMSGGGQFVLAGENSPDLVTRLLVYRASLQKRLFDDLAGDLSFNFGWAKSIEAALRARGIERHRAWSAIMTAPAGWDHKKMRFDDIAPPCVICRKRPATQEWTGDGPTEHVCIRCHADRYVGERIPRVRGVTLMPEGAGKPDARLLGREIQFAIMEAEGLASRAYDRHVPVNPDDGRLATFEQIASMAQGDELLGVLKADVDDFGSLVAGRMRSDDIGSLSEVSRDLDGFFSVEMQRTIRERSEWRLIYTIFSGGDDLLLVGPWDVMLDFACAVEAAFASGPGLKYSRTLSAAVSFMPPRIPIRHAVARAEDQLRQAKKGPKHQCATLLGVWQWDTLLRVLGEGRRLVKWHVCGAARKGLLRRLYRIAECREPAAHLWAWELARNFPSRSDTRAEFRLFREWGRETLRRWGSTSVNETRAALLYALTATRSRSKNERR